ncbi:hypothetical protein EGW08_013049 [Elysia chlorotica]|uniref:VWFA domain-containing protein n=1 Tax=Elysia chlorotica TaxID=188477 RepID=A0A433TC71_ELYCH|nr:hypothetical protein EGW08_013049 [Elysia chlorotica]
MGPIIFILAAAFLVPGLDSHLVKRQTDNCPDECKGVPLEISFIVDNSASIWRSNFTTGLWFVQSFADEFNIGADEVRVSFLTYGDRVYTDQSFDFDTYSDKKRLNLAIDSIEYKAGLATETGMAIDWYLENQLPKARPNVRAVLIVLTDGNSQQPEVTKAAARRAADKNLDVFAIGVGNSVSEQELHNIATDGRHVFRVGTYDMLSDILRRLAYEACNACQFDPVDLAFVIDSSQSIGEYNFSLGLKFIKEFLEPFVINPSSVRVAAIMFADKIYAEKEIPFEKYHNKKDTQDAFLALPWMHGTRTETGQGIDYMVKNFLPRTRPHAAHLGIVITDGRSQSKWLLSLTIDAAVTCNIDSVLDREELEEIAGDPARVLHADSYRTLNTIKEALTDQTCVGNCAGRKRFQIILTMLVVWSCGFYLGSKDRMTFRLASYVNQNEITDYSGSNLPSDICKFPEIDPFDPSIETHLKRKPPLNCSSNTPNLVYLENDEIKVDSSKLKQALKPNNGRRRLGFCQYQALERKANTDAKAIVTFTSVKFKRSINLNNSHEHIKVECFDTNNTAISRSYFTVMRLDPENEQIYDDSYKVHIDKNSPLETLSILMIGIDGFSKQHFTRSMPKTRDFLLKELGALEMHKHNKLGYSTSPNVVPLLTGRTNEEFAADSKWQFQTHGSMDQINAAFAWSDARRLGYRTALVFDQVTVTAFHYERQGFNKKPVDHYLRPIVLESEKDTLIRTPNKNCYGDEAEVSKLYDYILQLFHHYNSTNTNRTPFFAYSFLARLTHNDYNMAFSGDHLYLKLLKDLRATNALNNTVIIWFSDHGERFGALRNTYTGEMETNTPYLFFVFPPWFEKKYPDLIRMLRINQNRLTSHFDTYATLQDLLNFKGVVGPKGKLTERSISLFREIPVYRTCPHAQIPWEYCACFSSPPSQANIPVGLADYMGGILKEGVMSKLKKKEQCSKLSVRTVQKVVEEKATEKGAQPGFRYFIVSITTIPGEAQFEAKMSFDLGSNRVKVVGEIDRKNSYQGQADCVDTEELKKYCYCESLSMVTSKPQ